MVEAEIRARANPPIAGWRAPNGVGYIACGSDSWLGRALALVTRVAREAPVLAVSSGMDNILFTWLVVGLIAGALASFVSRGTGYGIVGDIVLGIAGAFVGGWGFRQLHWHAPFAGLAGVIFVAFIGAVALLFAMHLISGRRNR